MPYSDQLPGPQSEEGKKRFEEYQRRETLLNRVRQMLLAQSTQEKRRKSAQLEKLLEEALVETNSIEELPSPSTD